jgi:hypothetical protein
MVAQKEARRESGGKTATVDRQTWVPLPIPRESRNGMGLFEDRSVRPLALE